MQARRTCYKESHDLSRFFLLSSLITAPSILIIMELNYSDERAFRELTFKWSIAWDTKDMSTFIAIATPQFVGDYSDLPAVGKVFKTSAEGFFKTSFRNEGLGDPRLQTQHLLGLGVFTRISETEARGDWQVRARHVRVLDNGETYEWDSSSFVEFTYLNVEGEWKLGGIRPHTVVANTGQPNEVIGVF
ncbi:uncharacterized protein B0J16DRAFT_351266 [Fusarium flagelliforme]|uniref:uncharacterized protein n=1 Tax=Fusarium flagelliforme TaxID=2675880 RepID=UPI001E8E56AE|nr:uncharacterized protein B0J16DRAFT_351266 [Fusarium flagelliforme]KAH7174040.1 hypothetical protein B0J16DRAFT_351266 [Fusarium flagelliforme]